MHDDTYINLSLIIYIQLNYYYLLTLMKSLEHSTIKHKMNSFESPRTHSRVGHGTTATGAGPPPSRALPGIRKIVANNSAKG